MKRLILLLFVASNAWGQTSSLNLAIPQSPQSFQTDRFRAGDLDCSSAIGSATNVEFGVVGIVNQGTQFMFNDPAFVNNDRMKDIGVYGKLTIPIGGPKERINCNVLYQLELEARRLEVEKLRQELRALQALKFEN